MFENLTPNLMVKDVNRSVEFYTEILSFEFIMGVPEGTQETKTSYDAGTPLVHAMVRKDKVEVMLHKDGSFIEEFPEFKGAEPRATMGIYIMVDEISSYYTQVKSHIPPFKDMHTQWYGNKEFYVKDPDGYILGFAQSVIQEGT